MTYFGEHGKKKRKEYENIYEAMKVNRLYVNYYLESKC